MSDLPAPIGAPTSLENLRTLKTAIADCVAREAEVERVHRLETARAKRECEESIETTQAELATALESQAAGHLAATEAESARHGNRIAWLTRAYGSAQTRVVNTVETQKGRKIGEVQSQTLEAKRQHEADVADAKNRLADLENQLRSDKRAYNKIKADARGVFRGFPLLTRSFNYKPGADAPAADSGTGDVMLLEGRIRDHLHRVEEELGEARKRPLPALFRFLPLQWLVPLAAAAIVTVGALAGWGGADYTKVGGIAAAVAIGLLVIQRVAAKSAAGPAGRVAEDLQGAARSFAECRDKTGPWLEAKRAEMETGLEEKLETLNSELGSVIADADSVGESEPERLARQQQRLSARVEASHTARAAAIEEGNTTTVATLEAEAAAANAAAEAERERRIAEADATHAADWETLIADWHAAVDPAYQTVADQNASVGSTFPAWDAGWTEGWNAPADFAHAAPFARLGVDVETLADGLPENPDKLPLPGGEKTLDVPLCLSLPLEGSVLIETETSGDPVLIGALNNLILRLLSVAPPGKLSFSILDPVGLGQNFAGLTHLADYEDSLINKRVWTSRDQIEGRIAELNEHMEKVIQMYLRNEYETITEYNLKAGNIAEKYHFLVIADFPTNFSEQSIRGLLKIAASGARCGIYTVMHWDKRATAPEAFLPEEMRKNSIVIEATKKGAFRFPNGVKKGCTLTFDPPPSDAVATSYVKKVGDASDDSNRIEVPFEHIVPDELWTGDATSELSVPIGRSGATKLQNLAFGKGTRQHALIAGKTGSGKSTLFHVVVTNMALHFSPDEVQFYLVDFKKGVEFKAYGNKKLPHAKVIAIESDREFGLSVLQRLDEELKRRGEMFRKLGSQDVAGFRKAEPGTPLPRILLMIDEFQEYFVEDDKIAQQAGVLLDRIVRQGRAFGIHVFLGSQTLGGAYSLARATLGQMVIRVALMCNEADALLIMDEGNAAAQMLTRPGEGIYNDGAGAIENNSPFQTVWLPEEVRDEKLDQVNAMLEKTGREPGSPIVFEGNAPSDVTENLVLNKLRDAAPASPPSPKIWLGAPNAIKGPTEVTFHRQSGNHLLVVGQRDDAVLAMFGIGLVTLSAQYPAGGAKFVVIDGSPPGSPEREWLDGVTKSLPHEVATTSEKDVGDLVGELAAELKTRQDSSDAGSAPPIFVFINGVQKYKKLRYDEDLAYSFDASASEGNPALQLADIISEGSALGIHLITATDSYNNLMRTLSRKALGEFEMRVLFQMSANDSAALVDSTKAGNLGMHRALFYNEHEGYLETFRPYAQPPADWLP